MAEFTSNVQAHALTPVQPAAVVKPFRTYPVSQADPAPVGTTSFNVILLLIVLSLLGGILAMLARGGMQRWQAVVGSSEGLISLVFLAQVAAAVLCFAFLIRWIRS